MFEKDNFVSRVRIEVDLVLTDGTTLRGSLFAMQKQRLVDIMNDPRGHIPIELEDGRVTVINKAVISTVTPIQQDEEEDRKERTEKWQGTFAKASMEPPEAYKILGLSPRASNEQIQTAQKKLLLALHPDKGGSDYLAAKINQAVLVLTTH
ncbi:MAG: DnaJ domain-containing protein [Rhodospirillales bacterium]